ncbi:serine hydrolase [Flavihumibacter sp. R14]|nr:serine hydrolase [Flavihumibacter soli]
MKFFLPVITALIINTLYLPACAQSNLHQQNERRIQEDASALKSTVLLNNKAGVVPVRDLATRKVASVNMGMAFSSNFDSLLNKYASVTSFTSTAYNTDSLDLDDLSDDLKFFNTVVIQVTDEGMTDPKTIGFLLDNQRNKQIIVCLFGNEKSLKLLEAIDAPIIWTEKESAASAEFVAQGIFGGTAFSSRLKHNVSADYKRGDGFTTESIRLKYSVPEAAGINIADLNGIDNIAAEAIRERATPGAVVMVVKNGTVIFNKAYGNHTYDGKMPTRINDIFDLASVTKISATTVAVMRLFEQDKLKLDTNIGAYIPKARKTNKNDISVREVMLHQAGFVPFIPFYKNMKPTDSSRDSSAAYPVKAADNYYMRKGYFETTMWPQMLNSAVVTRGKYVYSDLSMYFMKEMVERQSGEHLETYVLNEFYKPLGMKTAGFNPRNRFSKDQIVPTENDTYFRKTLLHGYVHDQGAAMVGGVSGHAGLFASANDLAIEYQMLLNGGSYGGTSYFKPETIKMFTSKQSPVSRRGLGFDRYDPDTTKEYPSKLASPETFGHTGYTGTCVWVDPKSDLIYIFLSNRVHPEVSDKLLKLNIRSRIQDVVYEAIGKINQTTMAK